MIYITLNESNFEYDIYSLMKAFFAREEIVIGTEEPSEVDGVALFFAITYEQRRLHLAYRVPDLPESRGLLSEAFLQSVSFDTWEPREIQITYGDRKDTKNRLKMLVYEVLCEMTGRTLPWGTLTGIRPTKIPLNMLEQGGTEADILSYMKGTYAISDAKAALCYQIAQTEHRLLEPIDYENGYSLYIGIPFCPSTCLYCSFTSYPMASWKDRMDEYLDCVFREIDFVAERLGSRTLDTIYIGGGTPTSLNAAQLDRLLTKLETSLDLRHLLEFTVEAGRPDSITEDKLQVLADHGIGRISINPQTMNQKTLNLIGRHHTVEQVITTYEMARRMGIPQINMDLIVGLPGETIADVAHTLEQIRRLEPDNLTVHSLAIKRSARLNLEWDKYRDCHMENSQQHMELAMAAAGEMGMQPYYLYRQKNMAGNLENIGFAKPGMEGLYNILIMEEKQTIMALGAGSACKYVTDHGATVTRSENVKDVAAYMSRIDEMIERKRKMLGGFE